MFVKVSHLFLSIPLPVHLPNKMFFIAHKLMLCTSWNMQKSVCSCGVLLLCFKLCATQMLPLGMCAITKWCTCALTEGATTPLELYSVHCSPHHCIGFPRSMRIQFVRFRAHAADQFLPKTRSVIWIRSYVAKRSDAGQHWVSRVRRSAAGCRVWYWYVHDVFCNIYRAKRGKAI